MNGENLIRNRREYHPLKRGFLDDLFFPSESTLERSFLPEISKNWILSNFNSELKEDNDNYYIKAELPGIEKENIDIEIDTNKVSIRAEKKEEKEENNKKSHFSEIYYGPFSRTYVFSVPVDVEGVKASSKNGILNLTIPKLVRSTKNSRINID